MTTQDQPIDQPVAQPTIKLSLRSFESKVYYMHGMYQLPVAPYPTIAYADTWQRKQPGTASDCSVAQAVLDRLNALKKILTDEVNEIDTILTKMANQQYPTDVDFLTDMADLMGDLIVYCASEMVRFGIPPMDTLSIIMDSNFSKLDANGQPIIKDGKFMKGPFYWKPEPAIKAMLEMRRSEYKDHFTPKNGAQP